MSYETFTPEANGLKPQRQYTIEPEFQVEEDERELGNLTSTAVADKERRVLRFRWVCETRAAMDYVVAFFRRHKGPAGRFYYAWPEFVAHPDAAPILEAVASGTQAERTITCRFAWKNTAGTTLPSPTATLLVPASSLVKVTVPVYPPSVSQCVIYASESGAGTEQEQTVLTDLLTWTQPDAALLLATADPPTANTATETPLMKAGGNPPYRITRGNGTCYEITCDLVEVYHA
jgi:hypothetical protein